MPKYISLSKKMQHHIKDLTKHNCELGRCDSDATLEAMRFIEDEHKVPGKVAKFLSSELMLNAQSALDKALPIAIPALVSNPITAIPGIGATIGYYTARGTAKLIKAAHKHYDKRKLEAKFAMTLRSGCGSDQLDSAAIAKCMSHVLRDIPPEDQVMRAVVKQELKEHLPKYISQKGDQLSPKDSAITKISGRYNHDESSVTFSADEWAEISINIKNDEGFQELQEQAKLIYGAVKDVQVDIDSLTTLNEDMQKDVSTIREYIANQHQLTQQQRQWDDYHLAASRLYELGALTGIPQLAQVGFVASLGIEGISLGTQFQYALAQGAVATMGSSGAGLAVVGIKLAMATMGSEQEDVSGKLLTSISHTIDEQHIEVIGLLDRIEENQLEIFEKVCEVYGLMKAHQTEVMSYLDYRLSGIEHAIVALGAESRDFYQHLVKDELLKTLDEIENSDRVDPFYYSQENYFKNNEILFRWLRHSTHHWPFLNGEKQVDFLGVITNKHKKMPFTLKQSLLDYLRRTSPEENLGYYAKMVRDISCRKKKAHCNVPEYPGIVNLPLWGRTVLRHRQFRQNGVHHNYHLHHGNSMNVRQFDLARGSGEQVKALIETLYQYQTSLFSMLFDRHHQHINQLLLKTQQKFADYSQEMNQKLLEQNTQHLLGFDVTKSLDDWLRDVTYKSIRPTNLGDKADVLIQHALSNNEVSSLYWKIVATSFFIDWTFRIFILPKLTKLTKRITPLNAALFDYAIFSIIGTLTDTFLLRYYAGIDKPVFNYISLYYFCSNTVLINVLSTILARFIALKLFNILPRSLIESHFLLFINMSRDSNHYNRAIENARNPINNGQNNHANIRHNQADRPNRLQLIINELCIEELNRILPAEQERIAKLSNGNEDVLWLHRDEGVLGLIGRVRQAIKILWWQNVIRLLGAAFALTCCLVSAFTYLKFISYVFEKYSNIEEMPGKDSPNTRPLNNSLLWELDARMKHKFSKEAEAFNVFFLHEHLSGQALDYSNTLDLGEVDKHNPIANKVNFTLTVSYMQQMLIRFHKALDMSHHPISIGNTRDENAEIILHHQKCGFWVLCRTQKEIVDAHDFMQGLWDEHHQDLSHYELMGSGITKDEALYTQIKQETAELLFAAKADATKKLQADLIHSPLQEVLLDLDIDKQLYHDLTVLLNIDPRYANMELLDSAEVSDIVQEAINQYQKIDVINDASVNDLLSERIRQYLVNRFDSHRALFMKTLDFSATRMKANPLYQRAQHLQDVLSDTEMKIREYLNITTEPSIDYDDFCTAEDTYCQNPTPHNGATQSVTPLLPLALFRQLSRLWQRGFSVTTRSNEMPCFYLERGSNIINSRGDEPSGALIPQCRENTVIASPADNARWMEGVPSLVSGFAGGVMKQIGVELSVNETLSFKLFTEALNCCLLLATSKQKSTNQIALLVMTRLFFISQPSNTGNTMVSTANLRLLFAALIMASAAYVGTSLTSMIMFSVLYGIGNQAGQYTVKTLKPLFSEGMAHMFHHKSSSNGSKGLCRNLSCFAKLSAQEIQEARANDQIQRKTF